MDFAPFDKRNYPTLSVQYGYREWSKTYDAVVCDEMDLDLLTRIKTVLWSDNSQVLDLAWGTGQIGAWLRTNGAGFIDGVDFTAEMPRPGMSTTRYTWQTASIPDYPQRPTIL